MSRSRPSVTLGCAAALLLGASPALADRVAVVPSRGGVDSAPREAIDRELARALTAAGHTLVPAPEIAAAMKAQVIDGAADTQEEYRGVGVATRADWVIAAQVEPAVTTERVEIAACLVKPGRVESVAREVEKARAARQIEEMLRVLVRAEGVGAGALPWERIDPGKAPPAPERPAVPAVDGRARVAYPIASGGEVWPPYSGGKRGFVSAALGFSMPVVRPLAAGVGAPSGAALVAAARGGYAVTDLGLEPFIELGGNLLGPRALWILGGARWMFAPLMRRGADGVREGAPFFLGPEIVAGGFFQLGESALDASSLGSYSSGVAARPILGGGLALSLALARSFQIDAGLGNLRWMPSSGGSLLVLGATLGATLRL